MLFNTTTYSGIVTKYCRYCRSNHHSWHPTEYWVRSSGCPLLLERCSGGILLQLSEPTLSSLALTLEHSWVVPSVSLRARRKGESNVIQTKRGRRWWRRRGAQWRRSTISRPGYYILQLRRKLLLLRRLWHTVEHKRYIFLSTST